MRPLYAVQFEIASPKPDTGSGMAEETLRAVEAWPQPDPRRKQPIYKRRNALKPCEYCGAMMLPLPLKHHIKREHRNQIKALEKAASSKQTKKASRAASPRLKRPSIHQRQETVVRPTPGTKGMDEWKQKVVTAFNEIAERKLDRTRGYGHFSRENGRFGSHPPHDGFDDESSE